MDAPEYLNQQIQNLRYLISKFLRRLEKFQEAQKLLRVEPDEAAKNEIQDLQDTLQELNRDRALLEEQRLTTTPGLSSRPESKLDRWVKFVFEYKLIGKIDLDYLTRALAGLMRILPAEIVVEKIQTGSVEIDLFVPESGVEALRDRLKSNSAQLHLLRIQQVFVKLPKGGFEVWEKNEGDSHRYFEHTGNTETIIRTIEEKRDQVDESHPTSPPNKEPLSPPIETIPFSEVIQSSKKSDLINQNNETTEQVTPDPISEKSNEIIIWVILGIGIVTMFLILLIVFPDLIAREWARLNGVLPREKVVHWPTVTLGPVKPAQPQTVEPTGILYVLDRPVPRFASQLVPPPELSRFVAVPRQKQRPPDLSVSPIRLLPGRPAQVETIITSLNPLVSVEVRVNNQPIGSDAASFPAWLLSVQLCQPTWQRPAATGLVELCPPEQVSGAGSLDLRAAASRQAGLVLILTGQTPGTYRLTLTAADLSGRRSQTEYHITVTDSSL